MSMSNKMKWWLYGGFGALFFGSGLSIAIECSHIKHGEGPFWAWVIGGTVGIGLAVSGIIFLIRAGILEAQRKEGKGY